MRDDSQRSLVRTSPNLWVTLALTAAIGTTGAIAIAHAEAGAGASSVEKEHCSSKKPCLSVTNNRNGNAIDADSFAGSGVYAYSSSAPGVTAVADYGYGLEATAINYDAAIYSNGNVDVNGEIYTGGSCKNGCSRTRHQESFASRSSQPTIDDVGEATLRDGVARVALAADFVNVIDPNKPYVVLLTSEGDASLYVANRTPSGFEVRQVGGGHSSVSFAYRIVAKPYAVKDERLPFRVKKG